MFGYFFISLIYWYLNFVEGFQRLDVHFEKQTNTLALKTCSDKGGGLASMSFVDSRKHCLFEVLQPRRSRELFWIKRDTGLSSGPQNISKQTSCVNDPQGCLAALYNGTISCKRMNCTKELHIMCDIDAQIAENDSCNSLVYTTGINTTRWFQTTEPIKHENPSFSGSSTSSHSSGEGGGVYAIAVCFCAAIIVVLVLIFRRQRNRKEVKKRGVVSKNEKSSTSTETLSESSRERVVKEENEMTLMNFQYKEGQQLTEEESSIYHPFSDKKASNHKERKKPKNGIHGSNPAYEMSLTLHTKDPLETEERIVRKVEKTFEENKETTAQYFILQKQGNNIPVTEDSNVYLEPIMLTKLDNESGKDNIGRNAGQMNSFDVKSSQIYSLSNGSQISCTPLSEDFGKTDANPYESIGSDSPDFPRSPMIHSEEQSSETLESKSVYQTIEETQYESIVESLQY